MNEIEAKRIAAVITIVRPEWRQGLIMSVLADERIRHRVYEDVLVAAIACYSDLTTKKPGRLHEPGRWWLTVTASAPTVEYRKPTNTDCSVCNLPQHICESTPKTERSHGYEPRHVLDRRVSSGQSARPNADQRAAIDKANAEALAQVTAAKEAAEKKRVVASVEDAIARHTTTTEENA